MRKRFRVYGSGAPHAALHKMERGALAWEKSFCK